MVEQGCGDAEQAWGPDAEVYRCEHCKTLYTANLRGLNVAGQETSVFGPDDFRNKVRPTVRPSVCDDLLSNRSWGVSFENPKKLVIPKPALSARNLFAAGSGIADSSRDKAALRNDNSFGVFK